MHISNLEKKCALQSLAVIYMDEEFIVYSVGTEIFPRSTSNKIVHFLYPVQLPRIEVRIRLFL